MWDRTVWIEDCLPYLQNCNISYKIKSARKNHSRNLSFPNSLLVVWLVGRLVGRCVVISLKGREVFTSLAPIVAHLLGCRSICLICACIFLYIFEEYGLCIGTLNILLWICRYYYCITVIGVVYYLLIIVGWVYKLDCCGSVRPATRTQFKWLFSGTKLYSEIGRKRYR